MSNEIQCMTKYPMSNEIQCMTELTITINSYYSKVPITSTRYFFSTAVLLRSTVPTSAGTVSLKCAGRRDRRGRRGRRGRLESRG